MSASIKRPATIGDGAAVPVNAVDGPVVDKRATPPTNDLSSIQPSITNVTPSDIPTVFAEVKLP